MSADDRKKWDRRYEDRDRTPTAPSVAITELAELLPRRGRALDLAGGHGRHAIWLARRGLDVTVADISPVGLGLACERAEESGLQVRTACVDLESDPLPRGPWDLILCVRFLLRDLFPAIVRHLRPGGTLVYLQPTKTNLERHAKPPAAFLVEENELRTLAAGLDVVHYTESWRSDGRHEALLVACRPMEIG